MRVRVCVCIYVCILITCLLSHSLTLTLTYISFIGCLFDAPVMIFFARDYILPPCAYASIVVCVCVCVCMCVCVIARSSLVSHLLFTHLSLSSAGFDGLMVALAVLLLSSFTSLFVSLFTLTLTLTPRCHSHSRSHSHSHSHSHSLFSRILVLMLIVSSLRYCYSSLLHMGCHL